MYYNYMSFQNGGAGAALAAYQMIKQLQKLKEASDKIKGNVNTDDDNVGFGFDYPYGSLPCMKDLQSNLYKTQDLGAVSPPLQSSSKGDETKKTCDWAYNKYIVALKTCSKNNERYTECSNLDVILSGSEDRQPDNFIIDVLIKSFIYNIIYKNADLAWLIETKTGEITKSEAANYTKPFINIDHLLTYYAYSFYISKYNNKLVFEDFIKQRYVNIFQILVNILGQNELKDAGINSNYPIVNLLPQDLLFPNSSINIFSNYILKYHDKYFTEKILNNGDSDSDSDRINFIILNNIFYNKSLPQLNEIFSDTNFLAHNKKIYDYNYLKDQTSTIGTLKLEDAEWDAIRLTYEPFIKNYGLLIRYLQQHIIKATFQGDKLDYIVDIHSFDVYLREQIKHLDIIPVGHKLQKQWIKANLYLLLRKLKDSTFKFIEGDYLIDVPIVVGDTLPPKYTFYCSDAKDIVLPPDKILDLLRKKYGTLGVDEVTPVVKMEDEDVHVITDIFLMFIYIKYQTILKVGHLKNMLRLLQNNMIYKNLIRKF